MPQTNLQAGDLRAKVGFYRRIEQGDAYGNAEGKYKSVSEFDCAARIVPRLGGENVLASRLTGTNLVNVTVRQSSRTRSVDDAWMLKDERTSVAYNIRSIIDPDEGTSQHGRFFELLCEKGAVVGDQEDVDPMPLTWPAKDPDEVLDYEIDWTARLAGDTIASSTWTVPSGLTGSSQTHTDTTATTWLAEGTAGESYSILNRVVTSGGRTMDQTVTIKIVDR